jgi:hypothetical protein
MKAGHAAHHCGIVLETPVAVKFNEVLKKQLNEFRDDGPLW